VMKGVGGIYGNRGGVKQFPVCKVCDEIMNSGSSQQIGRPKVSKRTFLIVLPAGLVGLFFSFLPGVVSPFVPIFVIYVGLIGGVISLIADFRKARRS
jgi:hypothetical protein